MPVKRAELHTVSGYYTDTLSLSDSCRATTSTMGHSGVCECERCQLHAATTLTDHPHKALLMHTTVTEKLSCQAFLRNISMITISKGQEINQAFARQGTTLTDLRKHLRQIMTRSAVTI